MPTISKMARFVNNVVVALYMILNCYDAIQYVLNDSNNRGVIALNWILLTFKAIFITGANANILTGITVGQNATIAVGL